MKTTQVSGLDLLRKTIPLLGFVFLLNSCGQWGMDPDEELYASKTFTLNVV